ncbi:MAG: hypothetical protein KAX39_00330 [candidate division Zixibacteria bacterium]|nr:hypothetical protein [candidate division Zixibacteria bacterium]
MKLHQFRRNCITVNRKSITLFEKGRKAMKAKIFFTGILFAVFFLVSLSYADVPQMINYQGKLTTASGGCVGDTTISMTFKIYADLTTPTSLWSETQDSVKVEDGIFNVLLGSVNPIPDSVFDRSTRYLGVKVGADNEMSPRKPLVSVGYAFRSEFTDTAEYARAAPAMPDDDWVISGDDIYRLTGNVGIGTAGPAEKLDVVGTTRMTGFKMPTDAADGYVLTSDPSGVGTWQEAVGGGNWSVTDSVLYTNNYWGIARGGAGNVLYGDSAHTMVNLGVACTTGTSGQNYYYSTISGGERNKATCKYSTVGGGYQNTATYHYATVGGGVFNTASNWKSTVGGGSYNTANGDACTIGGGQGNVASNNYSTVGGGGHNAASGGASTVGGGYRDTSKAVYGGVFSGYSNLAGDEATDTAAFVGGGYENSVTAKYATVGGGNKNFVEGDYSAILGGRADTITATADYSYLFGIKSKLTEDSTFMVDMPHIRFGDETNGYEFPTSDGANNQVMATDGSGQLSWVDVSGGGGGWVDDGTVVRLETSTDNVGIGTTSPEGKLHVESSNTPVIHTEYTGTTGGDPKGIYAKCVPVDYYGKGGVFEGGRVGVYGQVYPSGSNYYEGVVGAALGGSGVNYGVLGYASESSGTNYGVYGSATGTGGGSYGVYGDRGSSTGNYAGYFHGNVYVTGTLGKGGGAFKIDHPLDPENKYLYHSFVESPDMMNVYNGNIILDAIGEATVELPDYFEAVNKDFRYQLTAIGAPGPNLYIAEETFDNHFKIAGGEPGMKVSWQVTGIRHDKFAEANRIQVEVDKPAEERGKYLHPESYGLGEEYGLHYEEYKRMEEQLEEKSE